MDILVHRTAQQTMVTLLDNCSVVLRKSELDTEFRKLTLMKQDCNFVGIFSQLRALKPHETYEGDSKLKVFIKSKDIRAVNPFLLMPLLLMYQG